MVVVVGGVVVVVVGAGVVVVVVGAGVVVVVVGAGVVVVVVGAGVVVVVVGAGAVVVVVVADGTVVRRSVVVPPAEVGRRAAARHEGAAVFRWVDNDPEGVGPRARGGTGESGVAVAEEAAVGGDEPVAGTVRRGGHADDRLIQADGTGRAVERASP